MHTTPLKLSAAAVAAALTLAACGDDDKSSSDRTASRSGGDAAQTTPRSGASTSSSQSANTPAGTDGVTSGTNPTATGQSGATMSGNVPSNASPGSPAGAAPGATSTLPPQTNSPSPNSPTAVQGNPGSPPTTGSSPAGGATGPSASAAAATAGAASAATAAARGDASRNAIGTTEKRFINNAASGGLLEVEAGRVVAQQATSPAVRQLAEKLVRDHETANSELKQLAAAKGVQVPAEMSREDRAMVDKLRKMQGRDLDRAYVEQVGRAHHRKDIEEFERTARESNDPDVRAFAQKQLPILRQHYEMAQQAAGQVTSSSK